jgi:hypothetical protein
MINFKKGIAIFVFFYISALLNCQNATQPDPLKGPWVEFRVDSICLHCRPIGYSKRLSPDSSEAMAILYEQRDCLKKINDSLHTNFNRSFDIFLRNLDESQEGNSNGINRIIYPFLPPDSFKMIDTSRHIGCHELSHLIAEVAIGHSPTELMLEGYANALDGFYGIYKDSNNFYFPYHIQLRTCKMTSFLSTNQLLDANWEIDERIYYPQSGCFIRYLFNRFGTQIVNKLYTLDVANIRSQFKSITGYQWDSIGVDYLNYLDSICQVLK